MAVHALIMAGGSGTRFWPLSRTARPKQCLSLDGGPSLLRATIERLLPLVAPARICVVTGEEMEAAVREELGPAPEASVFVEPSARNTLPCVAWVSHALATEGHHNDVLVVLPADHHVGEPDAFREALAAGIEAAEAHDGIVTLGLKPDRPETGFGYIELGPRLGDRRGVPVHRAAAFREKPGRAQAEAWVAGGAHQWNAGIFIARISVLLDAIARHQPRTAAALAGVGRALSPAQWRATDATSVDYGLMERHEQVYCLPVAFGWSDVGSWTGAGPLLPAVEGGRGRVGGAIGVDAADNVVWAPGKVVAMVGVQGLVLVETPDAILLMDAARAQDLRGLLERLRAELPAVT